VPSWLNLFGFETGEPPKVTKQLMPLPRLRSSWIPLAAAAAFPSTALAGMPSPDVLTDVAHMRLAAISFFIALILLCAAGVRLLWNRVLQASFPKLPRLTYAKSLGLIALWGLLFIVVLTMISGARELMTPGAWERDGATYKLKTTGPS
jgi:hypothetical protein